MRNCRACCHVFPAHSPSLILGSPPSHYLELLNITPHLPFSADIFYHHLVDRDFRGAHNAPNFPLTSGRSSEKWENLKMLGIYFFLNFSSSLSINTPPSMNFNRRHMSFRFPQVTPVTFTYYILSHILLSSSSLGDYSRSSFLLSLVSIGLIAFATQVRVSCFFSSFILDISCLSFWISQSTCLFFGF